MRPVRLSFGVSALFMFANMEKTHGKTLSGALSGKFRGKGMSTLTGTFDANTSLAESLRGLGAKIIARWRKRAAHR